ncbi:Condensation domain [Phytophthora cactorum]|nr:Condensation domain [Phytophthora cactorum]
MHEADESAMTGIVHDNSLLNSQDEAVDLAALTRALDAGQVDVAVHWLQLLLLSRTGDQPIQHSKTLKSSRVRRLKTLQNAVAQMLDDYEKHTEEEGLTLRPGLAVRTGDLSCELSYSQLQMFALQRLQPSSTAYNVVRALLLSTCDALMVKHEALRTCFDVDTNAGGQPRQIVHPLAHFRGELEESSNYAELAAFVAKTMDEPFDLARQAPIRVYAFTTSSQLFWSDFHELYARFLHKDDHVTIQEFVQNLETKTCSAVHLTYRDFACGNVREYGPV